MPAISTASRTPASISRSARWPTRRGAACATDCCDIRSRSSTSPRVRHVYGERVNFYSGDGEVAPGVTLHRVGGHSDGLQVVRVETARGPVVLASDAAHYYANLQRRSPFPIVYNVGDMAVGWETIERLAGHPDRFIPGHDPIVTEIYPRASDKVDVWALHLPPSRSFAK